MTADSPGRPALRHPIVELSYEALVESVSDERPLADIRLVERLICDQRDG